MYKYRHCCRTQKSNSGPNQQLGHQEQYYPHRKWPHRVPKKWLQRWNGVEISHQICREILSHKKYLTKFSVRYHVPYSLVRYFQSLYSYIYSQYSYNSHYSHYSHYSHVPPFWPPVGTIWSDNFFVLGVLFDNFDHCDLYHTSFLNVMIRLFSHDHLFPRESL